MLSINDLTVEYTGGSRVLDGLSFAVSPGENAALIGANGAGKTTLMLTLAGVIPAWAGEVRVNGIVMNKKNLRGLRSRVGLVFQNPDDQLFMPNIYEDIAFGPRGFGCGEEAVSARVSAALSRLGIEHLAERSPLKLSGGEKRLAAIATVLAMEPDYLLFDEPTAFLDPRARRILIKVLSELPQGKLIATHDLTFAEEVCPRVLLLHRGKLAAEGGKELLRDTAALAAAGL